jgi:methyltransferase-like protein
MEALGVDPYELYAYPGSTIPYTAPAHLALCARWAHGAYAATTRFSVVELGCGDGGNLLPLAFYNPDCMFVGIDSSVSALDRAEDAASRLGLTNLRYVRSDICDLSPLNFAPVDYVIAHGLYSWVTDDVRGAILSFCRDALAGDGLAYISYNAQPGWSTRQLVRDTLRRSRSVRQATMAEKATRAIELATRLLEDIPPSGFASTIVLADELARVRDGKPGYVFHEYLSETNDGFWLTDFVERARQNGLAYVVDAQFCRWEGFVPPELRKTVAKRSLDPIEAEETVDLLGHRYFRASILSKSDVPHVRTSPTELLQHVYIAASLRPQSESFDLTEGTVEHFAGTGGSDVTLEYSISKAAAALLASRWPSGIRLDQLDQDARSLLAAHDQPVQPAARSQLVDELSALFEAAQIDLRLHEPIFSSEVAEYPRAHALARWEAERRDALTTPYHRPVALDGPALELVRAMDGSRSKSDLQRAFGRDVVEQTFPILGRCGLLDGPIEWDGTEGGVAASD